MFNRPVRQQGQLGHGFIILKDLTGILLQNSALMLGSAPAVWGRSERFDYGQVMKRIFAAAFALVFWATTAFGQQPVWLQVEAQPSLREAQSRVEVYASRLDNVAGFYLGGTWYGIVLGPYARQDAEALLAQLKRDRAIPGDSFIATGRTFRQQFYPVGSSAATTAQQLPTSAEIEIETPEEIVEIEPSRTIRSGPALSMRRVLVATKHQHYVLSPRDRENFIEELKSACARVADH